MAFVHLNVHSNHSLLSGASTIEDLVWAASKLGMEALALTDTNGLYGAVPFQQACAAAGIRPIFGVEITENGFRGPEPTPKNGVRDPEPNDRFEAKMRGGARAERGLVIARDRESYAEICRLVTERHLGRRWRDRLGRRPGKVFPSEEAGDQTLSARPSGETAYPASSARPSGETSGDLADAIRRNIRRAFVLTPDEGLLASLAEVLPRENLFAELQHWGGAESRQRVYRLAERAKRLGVGTVATNRVHFLRPEGHRIHKVLSAIRTNTTIGSLPHGATVPREAYFKTPAAMGALFREFPEALANTTAIARACRMDLEIGRTKPPRFPLPPNESAFSLLCKEAFKGLSERYRPLTKQAYDTLSRELGVIEKLDLADYFLVCWDVVRWAREQGMPCLGRGSAANSIVSYCLYITHVDPLRHNLFFERFLNDERTTPPDFDIDFGTNDREKVLDYVFARYGSDRVAMICTLNQMHARSAVRETAKALGVPTNEIDAFAKRLPRFADPDVLGEVLDASPVTRSLPVNDEPFRTILSIAKRISGFPRHLATHPCGIIIAPSPITDFMPLQMGDKGLSITQWSMYPVEDAGLIKIDLLGQKGLAVIPETKRMAFEAEPVIARRTAGPTKQSPSQLPGDCFVASLLAMTEIDYLNDPLTKKLMSQGRTEGCFYIESPIMQQLFRQSGCDDFEVLTALSSIIRPGVSNHGGKRSYLMRHLGREKVEVAHPILEPILKDTYGCLIYQEQVIQIAAAMAGMSLGEADGMRKCMSKKGRWKPMETYKARFYDGARAQGIPQSVIDDVYRQIESFAGYAFCKAHSASYALESFESLYWKGHHPAEFMAAVLSNEGGYYSASEYVEEARRIGLAVLPPHVNASAVRFTAGRVKPTAEMATMRRINGWPLPPDRRNAVRVGLMQVRGLRAEMAEAIVAAQKERLFADLADLLARVPLNKPEAENLVRVGALDGLGPSRPALLWGVGFAFGRGPREVLRSKLPDLPDYDAKKRLALEMEILELTVSAHPLALHAGKVARVRAKRPTVRSIDLEKHVGETVYTVGWYVTGKLTSTQETKELMEFVTFSDEWGRFEATFFPKAYQRLGLELDRGKGPFLIKGRVEQELGQPGIVANEIALL